MQTGFNRDTGTLRFVICQERERAGLNRHKLLFVLLNVV